MNTMTPTPTPPLTITSKYCEDTKATRSTNPATLKRIVREFRRGEGDEVRITDADGNHWDLIDLGNGLSLQPRH